MIIIAVLRTEIKPIIKYRDIRTKKNVWQKNTIPYTYLGTTRRVHWYIIHSF